MVCTKEDDPRCGIKKKVLYAGKGEVPDYKDGTKVCGCLEVYSFKIEDVLWP